MSSIAAMGSSGSNDDNDGHQCKDTSRWQMVDEEMEALCDVDFPIFDKSAKEAEHHHDIKDDGEKSSSTANDNKPVGNQVVDEDAIIRCFVGVVWFQSLSPCHQRRINDDK